MARDIVGDIMTRNVFVAKRDTPLFKVYNVMKEKRFRHVPIVDNEKPIGVISQKDINLALKITGRDKDGRPNAFDMDQSLLVEGHYSFPPISISAQAPILDAVQVMIDKKIDSLLVVDGEKFAGILTTTDMLKILAEFLAPIVAPPIGF